MHWPPNMAWTSASQVYGYRHFVAINYGGEGYERWVVLVSVLDGKSRLMVKWAQMCDPLKWSRGWLDMPLEQADRNSNRDISDENKQFLDQNACLHASDDSGLIIPLKNTELRPWF